MTYTIFIILPILIMLALCASALLIFLSGKRWFTLLQLIGAGLIMLPNLLRLAVPGLIGGIESTGSVIASYAGITGVFLFLAGYLAMAVHRYINGEDKSPPG